MPPTTPNSRNQSKDRYGRSAEPEFRRMALAPGLLGAIALLVGFAIIESETFIVVRYVASILALIMIVFAVQGGLSQRGVSQSGSWRTWVWIVPLAAIAVTWNPAFIIPIAQPAWTGAQYLGVLVFGLAGVFIKVRPKAAPAR